MSRLRVNKEEEELHGNARDLMRANKPEELCRLLSEDKAKELIRKSGGKVLSYCLNDAIGHNHVECIQVLLKAGANPDIVGECHPINRTIKYGGHENILTLLLEYGADPNLKSFDGYYHSLLCLAAHFAVLGCFRTLLLYGADPDYNCPDRDFLQKFTNPQSVLGVCLRNGYEDQFVKLLIDFGANMFLHDIQESLLSAENGTKKLLERERAHPRSLMSQCRLMIRRLLRQNGKICVTDQLGIPNELQKYLRYHEEMNGPEKLPRHEEEYRRFLSCF
ncbi:PREDICTED: ankyrin repeat and SOCS box protein 12-like [Nanorana parkeri]|uniref:ankyrin repeat and SOCS box protein 12-like n=1 Tax=Nanorana parkeri TaxID=125878 RepID=UPI000854FC9D|nr:PREDICTED: ankyrin repeat and SOCS box protein 12-like [Nanorana parkeri]